jgi:nuclear transport factor 2 (NTF2) superfamily protein
MEDRNELIKRLYRGFNARDIDAVLVMLTKDVMWANAMDGGYAHGHDGIREYWTRQWAMVDPHVEPVGFRKMNDDAISVEVIQTIRDLDGNVLQDQTHGLKGKTVRHIFSFKNGLVSRFDVEDVEHS